MDKITEKKTLVLGATGFIGSRLVSALIKRGIAPRILVREDGFIMPDGWSDAGVEAVRGDVVKGDGLAAALDGVGTAFYLIHSMGGRNLSRSREFISMDRTAAENFITAAGPAGLDRVIYLGGLGEVGKGLSEHLASRAEVADILSSGRPNATIFRAAVIIGAGGASFEMLRYLVERLPVMVCPRWINTRIQPVAVDDVVAYLVGCLDNPATAGQRFDIGGPEILTYRKMMDGYTTARGIMKRKIITVPLLTPALSAYWVDLVTPVPSGIAHPLIEGMKNEVVCRDNRIDEYIKISKTPFMEAVKRAVREEKSGPGVRGF